MSSRSENKELHNKYIYDEKNISNKECKKYDNLYQKYLTYPTEYYLKKYNTFYNS